MDIETNKQLQTKWNRTKLTDSERIDFYLGKEFIKLSNIKLEDYTTTNIFSYSEITSQHKNEKTTSKHHIFENKHGCIPGGSN
jgi:hypothetical protein